MIDGIGRSGPQRLPVASGDGVARTTELRGGLAVKSPKAPATAQISGVARDLAASPPVDAARVAALRAAIAGGAYKPDPERIAAAMIRLESGQVPPVTRR